MIDCYIDYIIFDLYSKKEQKMFLLNRSKNIFSIKKTSILKSFQDIR